LSYGLNIRTYLAVSLAMIFWAFSFIWFKVANQTFKPITIVFLRLVISIVVLGIYLFLSKNFTKIRKEDRRLFFVLALFEPFFYFLGESFGLTYVSATVGSVVISTIPVFVALGAWMLFKERLRAVNYAGIILSFIGVLAFILNKDGSFSFSTKGLALLFLAVFSAVGYNLILSRLLGSYTPVFIVTVQSVIGAVLFLPIFLITDLSDLMQTTINLRNLLPVVELAIFASCGAFILFAYSVKRMGISKVNVFTNSIPVLTAIFSFFILGEKMTIQNILGMMIVITGLFLSQLNGRKKKTDDALVLTGKTA
jgi:drug/metabolite transporter (DMT)-like permease